MCPVYSVVDTFEHNIKEVSVIVPFDVHFVLVSLALDWGDLPIFCE